MRISFLLTTAIYSILPMSWLKYKNDAKVLQRLQEIKLDNKKRLAGLILKRNAAAGTDPHSSAPAPRS